jgi:AI-2 transport protein TqsA
MRPEAHDRDVAGTGGTDAQASRVPRGVILVLAVAGLLVAALAVQQFAAMVAPVVLALILVIAVHPTTGILHRRGLPMWLAVTITLIAVLAVILSLAAALALSIARLAAILPAYEERFVELVVNLRDFLASLGIGHAEVQAVLDQISFDSIAALLGGVLAGLVTTFSNLLFLIFVVAFMVFDAAGFSSRLTRARRQLPEFIGPLDTFVRGTRSYLLVTTVFGLIVATLDAVILWFLGVPLPLLWGLLAFITGYIPNVGYFIGLIPPALLALLEGGPRLLIIVILSYGLINFVIQSVIQPKVMSDTVNLSLTLTFLSLVFWTFIIGPVGAILAIPLTLLAKSLLFDIDPSTRWMSDLLAGGPAPPGDIDAEGTNETSDRESEGSPDGAALVADGPDRLPGQESAEVRARVDRRPTTG